MTNNPSGQRFEDDPAAIPGSLMIRKAIVRAYTPGTHKADLQIVGSHPTLAAGLRVATNIPAADVVPGRQATVLLLDPSNPDDAVIVAIQGALPSGGGAGYVLLAGAAGGQHIRGGTAASENLQLESTAHATKGQVQVVDGSKFAVRNKLGNYIGQAGGAAYTMLWIQNNTSIEATAQGITGLQVSPTYYATADYLTFIGVSGNALVNGAAQANLYAYGLDFVATGYGGAWVDWVGARARPKNLLGLAVTITNFEGFRAQPTMSSPGIITNYASFRSQTSGYSGAATAIGLKIDDITLGTNKYLIEAGPATPNLRVEATTPAVGVLDNEDSRVYIAFRNSGGVVTLRRLQTQPFSTLSPTTKVIIAV